MDDRNAVVIVDDTDLERLAAGGGSDEHGDIGIIGLESSPVVSKSVEHVVIGDTVLAGPRLDVITTLAYRTSVRHTIRQTRDK